MWPNCDPILCVRCGYFLVDEKIKNTMKTYKIVFGVVVSACLLLLAIWYFKLFDISSLFVGTGLGSSGSGSSSSSYGVLRSMRQHNNMRFLAL